MIINSDIMAERHHSEYLELFHNCFPHFQYSIDRFKWFNSCCPTGKSRTYLLFDEDDKIIGALSALPINIKLNKNQINGVLLTSGMIHPEYRSKNLFVQLEKYLIEKEKELGTSVFIGAPNKNIFRSHLKTGLTVSANLDFIGKFSFNKKENKCEQIQIFDDSFNELQNAIAEQSNFILSKDTYFLNWRYFQHPDNEYLVYARFLNNKPVGWVAIKQFNDNGYLKTHILDIAAVDFNVFKDLINQAEYFAHRRHELNTWQIDNSIYSDWFEKLGFIPTPNKNVLITFGLSKRLVKSDWWFVLGDNDVY